MIIKTIDKLISNKFIRFLFVGSFNTLVSFLSFSLLYYIGLHYTLATFLNLILGIFISFNTHKKLTFGSSSTYYSRFILVALFYYVIMNSFLYLADKANFNMYLSYLFILFPIAITNFFILRKYIFKIDTDRTISTN